MTRHERIVVLSHDRFPDDARGAVGLIRYGTREVVAVIDKARRAPVTSSLVHTLPTIPIVKRFDDVDDAVDALYLGIDLDLDHDEPDGGLPESIRRDVCAALKAGCDVIVAQPEFPTDDAEFRRLTAEGGGRIVDVGAPAPDLSPSRGRAGDVAATVLLTVGTDRYVGTSAATLEIVDSARRRDLGVAHVPTSQVGTLIEGRGVALDRVPSGLVSGAVERLITERGDDHDLLVVEGRGSVVHPGSSGPCCGLLHGAVPDGLVLCHAADRELMHGYDVDLPGVETYVDLYESLAAPVSETDVIAGALNTRDVAMDPDARDAVAAFADRLDAPATDPVRFGADAILDALDAPK